MASVQTERNKRSNLKKHENAALIPCECGCGTMIKSFGKDGEPRTYAPYHRPKKEHRDKKWKSQEELKAYCYKKQQEKKREQHELSPLIECACGCGTLIHSIGLSGQAVKYSHNHAGKSRSKHPRPSSYKTPDGRVVKDYQYSIDRDRWRKILLIEYMGSACEECGFQFDGTNPGVFDFHHRDPSDKSSNINKCLRRSWSVIMEEARKCSLLCANCHRLHQQGLDSAKWMIEQRWPSFEKQIPEEFLK